MSEPLFLSCFCWGMNNENRLLSSSHRGMFIGACSWADCSSGKVQQAFQDKLLPGSEVIEGNVTHTWSKGVVRKIQYFLMECTVYCRNTKKGHLVY